MLPPASRLQSSIGRIAFPHVRDYHQLSVYTSQFFFFFAGIIFFMLCVCVPELMCVRSRAPMRSSGRIRARVVVICPFRHMSPPHLLDALFSLYRFDKNPSRVLRLHVQICINFRKPHGRQIVKLFQVVQN